MKLNIRTATWGLALAFAVGTLGLPSYVAAYQSEQGMEHGRGHDKNNKDNRDDRDDRDRDNNDNQGNDGRNNAKTNNRYFQQGLSQGQYDRANNRGRKYRSNPRDTNDRQAYRSGYDQGYNHQYPQNGQNGTYGNRPYGNGQYGNGQYGNGQYGNGQYGNNSNNSNNPGFQMGSQDGANDGRSDRAAGRPLKYGPGYNHPDRGYNNSYGDKNAYQQQYRAGCQQAYQQAYNGQGYRR